MELVGKNKGKPYIGGNVRAAVDGHVLSRSQCRGAGQVNYEGYVCNMREGWKDHSMLPFPINLPLGRNEVKSDLQFWNAVAKDPCLNCGREDRMLEQSHVIGCCHEFEPTLITEVILKSSIIFNHQTIFIADDVSTK